MARNYRKIKMENCLSGQDKAEVKQGITRITHDKARAESNRFQIGQSRAWVEINLDFIAHNVKELCRLTAGKAGVIAVVKANAYGHGAVNVVKTILESGASMLAVSILDEALELRSHGITAPVLAFNYTDSFRAEEIVRNNITQSVYSMEMARALSNAAVRQGRKAVIHIKIDTGMSRVGFLPSENAMECITGISRLPGIEIEGIFSHFASADEEDESYTLMQLEKFKDICDAIDKAGIQIPLKHIANSAAILKYPEAHFNMVRAGIALYGLKPFKGADKYADLRPAMSLKAKIAQVKDVESGTSISYGRIFKTKRMSRIATILAGYADGYTRLLSGKASVLIKGQYAPVAGRICMDQFMADITDIEEEVKVGDIAVMVGTLGINHISLEDLAEAAGTINYEMACLTGRRMPRIYLKEGKTEETVNYLVQD